MTCDKNNKKETLRRTQGLTINQTTMMEMTSNAYKRKDWKQTGIARKDNFETNHKLYHKDMLPGIHRHRANTINDMRQKQKKRKHVEAQRRYG